MQPPDFIHLLANSKAEFYRYKNKVVDTTTDPTPLDHAPDGWQSMSIKWERNLDVLGIFRSFTTPLKFVKSAARIIRSRLYTAFTEDRIYLIINWLDKSFGGGWINRLFFYGELDLSQVKDGDYEIEVNIMEGDLIKLYNANKATQYEVPIKGPLVRMDGLNLKETANFSMVDGLEIAKSFYGTNWFAPIAFINIEGQSTGVTFQTQNIKNVSGLSFPDKIADSETLTDVDADILTPIPITYAGTIKFKCTENDPGLGFRMRFLTSAQTLVNQNDFEIFNIGPAAGNSYSFSFSKTIIGHLSDKVHLEGIYFGGASGAVDIKIEFLEGSDITATFFNKYKTTFVPSARPAQVAQALLDKMTGGGYTFKSNYLNNVWENLVVTSGDGLRNLSGAVIKTSLNSFIKSYNVPGNIEAHIEGRNFVIEPKANAFGQTLVCALGEAEKNTFELSIAQDFQYNTLQLGYPTSEDTTYESINGRGAFNSLSSFTSAVTREAKQLQIVSDYIASCGEIELIRINLTGKNTTDSNTDNNTYFIHIEKVSAGTTPIGIVDTPYFNLLRVAYDSITGVISPESVFNVEISPMRCLFAHGNYLRSIFYFVQGTKLVFQTSEKNSQMVTTKGAVVISEASDVAIAALAAPLFIPLQLASKNVMPREIVNVMRNTPMQTFSAIKNGITYYGYPMSISIQPATRPSQETILLCNPITDLTQFIR